MTYNEFKNKMTEDVKKYVNGKYPGYGVDLKQFEKVNRDQVDMIAVTIKDWREGPAIDVNELWDDMNQREMNYEEMRREVIQRLNATLDRISDPIAIDSSDFKHKIILTLINAEKNKNMLMNVRHRRFHEFAIVYRYITKEEIGSMASAIVTNKLIERYGFTEKELYYSAYENTKKDAVVDTTFGLVRITTKRGTFGAASILFPELLKDISNNAKSDLYLIPSSIDEWISIPVKEFQCGPEDVNEMIHVVNSSVVRDEDILGENCYYYDSKSEEIRIGK